MNVVPIPTRNQKRWALVLIVFLATFLRLYRIGDLPPGDGYDPAWYGVDALEILNGHLPVYLPTNIGREALFSYLVAVSVAIVGIGPHAIHLTAAIVGVLTIPATYLVAELLFAEEPEPLRTYGGLVSALALTVSFWHQHWSRYGVRAILVPPLTALTLWALANQLLATTPRRRTVYAAVTGGFLGLSLYTYQSARVLPLLVGLIALVSTTKRRTWSWRTLGNLLLMTSVGALLFAPMGIYLLRHPGIGNARIGQTWAIAPELSWRENARAIWAEVRDAVRVLVIEGDDEIIHNLPGRPAMNAFLLVLCVFGTLVALGRLTHWPYWAVLLWLPAMSITAILTLGGQPTKRALGALPAISLLVAIGALTPLTRRRASARQRTALSRSAPSIWIALLIGGFLYSAISTYRDYFLIWGRDPNLWTHFEAGRAAIGRYARSLPDDEVIYSSPEMPDHPSIVFNAGGRMDIQGYNGRICTVLPSVTWAPTTYILIQHEEARSLELLRTVYSEGVAIPAGPEYYGQPYFTAYRLPAGAEARIAPQISVSANWGEAIQFLGFDVAAPTVTASEPLEIVLYSLSLSPLDRDYVLFLHLMNVDGVQNPATGTTMWVQDDSEPCRGFYPTSHWHPGEIVRDTYNLHIPADAPAGAYHLQMGFYTWPDFQRLTTTGTDGTPEIAFAFGEIKVQRPSGKRIDQVINP